MTPDLSTKSDGAERQKPRKICPKCKATSANRISKGLFLKLFLFWRPVKKYQCRKCRKEYLVWG